MHPISKAFSDYMEKEKLKPLEVENFENIIVIKNGTIIESGSHSDLIGKKGMYYNLVSL